MVSPELTVLQEQVSDLQEDMKDMRLSVSGLLTLEPRMKAIEAQQQAQNARLEHVDRVVMSIQLAIQRLEKSFTALETQRAHDGAVMQEILDTQRRMLDLLQPKATL